MLPCVAVVQVSIWNMISLSFEFVEFKHVHTCQTEGLLAVCNVCVVVPNETLVLYRLHLTLAVGFITTKRLQHCADGCVRRFLKFKYCRTGFDSND